MAEHKIKKKDGRPLELRLEQNPDILAEVARLPRRPFVVGFAAETENVEQHARAKLEAKRLDLIAANHVGAGQGFETEDNALVLLWPGGSEELARADKRELAMQLVLRIAARLPTARNSA